MLLKKYCLLFLFSIALVACGGDDSAAPVNPPQGGDDDQEAPLQAAFTSFSIPASGNVTTVNADVDLGSNTIAVFLPANTDLTMLIPSFQTTSGAIALVNGVEITSGETAVDFSNNPIFEVRASDGTSNMYTTNITTNFSSLDAAIQSVMQGFNAPGMQVAITKGEKLVYANQYGFADLQGQEAVTENSLFRIASVSKPITIMAIFSLIEAGSLSFDDSVFGNAGVLGTTYGTPPYNTDIENITVKHLVEHTSGWTNNPFDPMFANINWSQAEVISDMVDNRPLETTPGDTYYYSNFGYAVLGRVVEAASGMSYSDYVKQAVLAPAGITAMEIAGNTLNDKLPNEVEYFGQEGFSPYAMNVTRMDSHGGWVASATDLARLLVVVDGDNGVADILSSTSLGQSFLGFDSWVFFGSLPGTSSVASKNNNEYNFSILANTRTVPDVNEILLAMQAVVANEIESRSNWPSYDLF